MKPFQKTLLVGLTLTSLTLPAYGHEEGWPQLFESLTAPHGMIRTINETPILRSCRVRLNPAMVDPFDTERIRPGSKWRFNLFNERELVVEFFKVYSPHGNALVAVGRVFGDTHSLVILSAVNGILNGTLTSPQFGRYQIQSLATGEHRLNEINGEAAPNCAASHEPPSFRINPSDSRKDSEAAPIAQARIATDSQEDESPKTTIDVMFAYTRSALDGSGGRDGILSLINLSVAEANTVFENSDLPIHVNLVHQDMVNASDSGSLGTDSSRLRSGNGDYARILKMRDEFGADLVTLISETDDEGWAGIGRILKQPDGEPERFTTVMVRKWIGAGFYLYTHEIAHNMGCQHDRLNAKNTRGVLSPGVFPYALGHRIEVGGVTHTTVMAYNPGLPLPFFSDPNLRYGGIPLGVPVGDSNEADNASALRKTAPVVAAYRDHLNTFELEIAESVLTEADRTVPLSVRRRGDTSQRSAIRISTAAGTANHGSDYESLTQNLSFDPGVTLQSVNLRLMNDDEFEPTESVEVSLSSPTRGMHLVSGRHSAEITILDDDWQVAIDQSEFFALETDSHVDIPVRYLGEIPTGEIISVPYGITGMTANATDSTPLEREPLTFTSDRLLQTIRIPIADDVDPEPDEVLTVTAGPIQATVRILDDDRSGSLDLTFLKQAHVPNGRTWSMFLLDPEHLLFGGLFNQVGDRIRTGLAGIDLEGRLSETFDPGTVEAQLIHTPLAYRPELHPLAKLADGSILVGGYFSAFDQNVQPSLARLTPHGAFDPSFHPIIDGAVQVVVEQDDGKLLIAGRFETVNGSKVKYLTRLLQDGSSDPSFAANVEGFAGWVDSIELDSYRRIIIAGEFTSVDGTTRNRIARLSPDGKLDPTFDTPREGFNGPVSDIHLLPDGRIYVSGLFTRVSSRRIPKLARLLPDGELDPTFSVGSSLRRNINDIAVIPDGRIFVVGDFTEFGRTPRGRIALLQSDGTLDPSFDPGLGADDVITSLALHGEGWLYVTGLFEHFNGMSSPYLARLKTDRYQPVIDRVVSNRDTLEIHLIGLPAKSLVLEQSQDLNQWSPYGDYRFEGSKLTVSIPQESSQTKSFYRIVSDSDTEMPQNTQ